jgi:acetyl-CoA C-acetyltransferase/acetyl-CoA acyltransferase
MIVFDRVLIDPTHDELTDAARAVTGPGLADADAASALAGAAHLGGAQGAREWRVGVASLLAVAWWSDSLGHRHVRVVGWEGAPLPDDLTAALGPTPAARVYPGRLICRQRPGQAPEWLAVCPCGVVGVPEAVGWTGRFCAACHDREEDGEARPRFWAGADEPSLRHVGWARGVALAPDGLALAASGQEAATLWRFGPPGRPVLLSAGVDGHASVAFLPDGRLAEVGPGLPGARLLDRDGRVSARFSDERPYAALAVSPDGRYLLAAGRERLCLWETASGQRLWWRAFITWLPAFSGDGTRCAVAGGLDEVRVYDAATGGVLASSMPPAWVNGVAFHPDGRSLAVAVSSLGLTSSGLGADGGVDVDSLSVQFRPLDGAGGWRALATRPGGASCLAFSPDGRLLATGHRDSDVEVRDAHTGHRLATFRSQAHAVTAVSFSPDGRLLLCGSEAGEVNVWPVDALLADDANNGKRGPRARAVASSRTGRTVMLDIAILDGVRTPFAKAFGPLAAVPAQELGRAAVAAVLDRGGTRPEQVDHVVFGNVAMPADAANVARVIALNAGIPRERPAVTVQRNCASALEALFEASRLIRLGEAGLVVAGGVESMSRIPLLYNDAATAQFLKLGKAKGLWRRLRAFLGFRPRHFRPVAGLELGLTDPVSGLIMGRTAEVLVRDFGLTRQEQDAYALESHRRAVAAQAAGRLAEEIVPVAGVTEDVGPRKNQTLEALAKLPPIFEPNGTVTAGNSSMLTDGAAALLVSSGEWARSAGRRPLGYLRAYAVAGCEPERMGLGPAFATAKLFDQTGLSLDDIDLIELNEAFAAVVLANERAFASADFCRDKLGRAAPLGTLDRAKMNVNGGAIALGHPVGATGARLVLTLLLELRRRGLRRGLATLCVGGGQGAAALVEVAE